MTASGAVIHFVEQCLKTLHPARPEPLARLQPVRGFGQWPRIQAQVMVAARAPAYDEAGALQDADVLGDRIERDVERLGQLRDPRLAGGEALQDLPAGLVREGHQGVVEVHGRNINPKG